MAVSRAMTSEAPGAGVQAVDRESHPAKRHNRDLMATIDAIDRVLGLNTGQEGGIVSQRQLLPAWSNEGVASWGHCLAVE